MDLDFNQPLTTSLAAIRVTRGTRRASTTRGRACIGIYIPTSTARGEEVSTNRTGNYTDKLQRAREEALLSHYISSAPGWMRKVSRVTRKLADIGSRRETFASEFLPINGEKFVTRRGTSTHLQYIPIRTLRRGDLVARNYFFSFSQSREQIHQWNNEYRVYIHSSRHARVNGSSRSSLSLVMHFSRTLVGHYSAKHARNSRQE